MVMNQNRCVFDFHMNAHTHTARVGTRKNHIQVSGWIIRMEILYHLQPPKVENQRLLIEFAKAKKKKN